MSANDNTIAKRGSQPRTISVQRIEQMLLYAARLVDDFGPAAEPLLRRLESEYLAAKKGGSEVDRIRNLIAAA